MPICANPGTRRIKVKVGEGKVVLMLRDYSAAEYIRFMGDRYEFKPMGGMVDRSMQSRLNFVDDLLVGISAEDNAGNKDSVTYVHPLTGVQEPLTPEVENWKSFINPSWKIAAAQSLESESVAIESPALKN